MRYETRAKEGGRTRVQLGACCRGLTEDRLLGVEEQCGAGEGGLACGERGDEVGEHERARCDEHDRWCGDGTPPHPRLRVRKRPGGYIALGRPPAVGDGGSGGMGEYEPLGRAP
jgi:hypothetical protein